MNMKLKVVAAGVAAALSSIVLAAPAAQRSGVAVESHAQHAARGGYPTDKESRALYDELDYQRAVQAYIWGVPLVNSVALAGALEANGVNPAEPSWLVFNQPITTRQIMLTGNQDLLYGITVVDVSKTGPVVLDVPAGVLGTIVDFWMRGLQDVGVGPSANGGKFLILPPGYEGPVPSSGYIVVRATSKKIIALGRGALTQGKGTEAATELLSKLNIYRLSDSANPPPATVILQNGKPFNSDWPTDARYFDYLSAGLSSVLLEPKDKLMYAMLEPLGIGMDKPFAPDQRVKSILKRAASSGNAMVRTIAYNNRFGKPRYWPSRQWETLVHTTTPESETKSAVELDERAHGWYQIFMNPRYLYTYKPVPGQGSFYLNAYRDKNGAYLDGGKTYRLRISANPPVKHYWSMTIYDNNTRSLIDTDQRKASLSSYSPLKRNQDGSIDLYFGPRAPQGTEENWIKTTPGKGYFAMFRAFGPQEGILDKSWQLADIVPLK